MSIAEEGVYQPLWSDDILDELRRNLKRYGVPEQAVEHRIKQMTTHFPGSTVEHYDQLTQAMINHPKDKHVLAAAVRGEAELIVTENVTDFPDESTKPYDIDIVTQECFLLDQRDLAPQRVRTALEHQVSRYRRTPRTVEDLLIALGRPGNGCPEFAKQCHTRLAR